MSTRICAGLSSRLEQLYLQLPALRSTLFLVSSARYWLEEFHADGLRVDAVNSILRLDYSHKEGEWEPNEFERQRQPGGDRICKQFNETVYRDFPDVQTIAEEASDWPQVSHPTTQGGLSRDEMDDGLDARYPRLLQDGPADAAVSPG